MLPKLLVDVGYVGNKSRDIMILGDYNQARPNGPTENATLQARRPIQGFQEIQIAWGGGKGDYHALQFKVEQRYSRGLYLLNSFTWSRARDNASGHLEVQNNDNSRVNYLNLAGEFGRSGYDQPLNNTTSFVWELPFGKDRRYASNMNAVLEGILGGWRLVGINTLASGTPVNLSYSPVAAFSVSGSPTYRPNLLGDPLTPEDQRTIGNYLNSADGRDPDRSFAAVRQRPAQRRARARLRAVRSRPAQGARPRPRQHPSRAALRGVQPVQPLQLQHAERQPLERQLRNHHLDVSGPADSVGSEGALLTLSNPKLQIPTDSQLPEIPMTLKESGLRRVVDFAGCSVAIAWDLELGDLS